ncbi:PREDICTED: baculoviral IAP repeat-containing protein 5 [Ceratosolen solmsi marchali]|uniref:Baculoviral IAP repeat-containing protein 5 n=1 Tax=Ceratosolen solmsi marchali TaxID=326594 RepID=A0AAJ6YER0_9HYME|nr:PREDICTED: baculoviral IAP repeat-containing protein 5 [Ceratosolen solmsi marchali]
MKQESINTSLILENLNPTFWKKGRLETFGHWPYKSESHRCTPENMASAGFFAVGEKDEPDLVECFICSKQLDGWEPDDDPWQEHKKHQPNCLYIKLNKSDEGSLTIKELFQLMQHYYARNKNLEFEKLIGTLKEEWKTSASEIPHIYEEMKSRQKSID